MKFMEKLSSNHHASLKFGDIIKLSLNHVRYSNLIQLPVLNKLYLCLSNVSTTEIFGCGSKNQYQNDICLGLGLGSQPIGLLNFGRSCALAPFSNSNESKLCQLGNNNIVCDMGNHNCLIKVDVYAIYRIYLVGQDQTPTSWSPPHHNYQDKGI